MRCLLTALIGLLLAQIQIAAAGAVPAPTAEERAMVEEKWLNKRLPCNVRDIRTDRYLACLKVLVERMEPLDSMRREQFGEFYDPSKYYECRKTRPTN